MNKSALYYLQRLKRKYLILRSGEILLFAVGIALLLFGILTITGIPFTISLLLSLAGILTLVVTRYASLKLHHLDDHRVVAFINRQYPTLQQSTDLLVKDNSELTSLQRLQKEKVIAEFTAIYPEIRFPNHVLKAGLFFLFSLISTILLTSFAEKKSGGLPYEIPSGLPVEETRAVKLPAIVKEINIHVLPPAYTGKPAFTPVDPNLTVPEGSTIQWKVSFTDSVKNVQLIFSGGENQNINPNGFAQRSFSKSAFYQLSWTLPSGEIKTSDFYKIEVIPDEAPDILVQQLQQFTQLSVGDKLSFTLRSSLTDDYSISNAYVIATVSKGSGESVKFREEKLLFTSPSKIEGKNLLASQVIDLIKLGLEPGDELYFYVEALDNKTPVANRSRTETFFVALQDTASQQLSVEGGLGVDLMPEYFRSQRQIIIDSEKLLRDRKNISKQEFNSRSNELGYDQKVLRLKYGEFLGEEFESAIGPGSELPVEDHAHEDAEETDPKEKYGHVHDKGNEHNLVPDKKQQSSHNHEAEIDPDKKEDPTEAYKHQHDDPEEATFFTQSIRSKLKAALTVMWDAELHLRMFDPEKSLPFQYTALKLLKEISNDSRIYVHKTGFDPPPLKEEKRLSGDLMEIKSSRYRPSKTGTEAYPQIKLALSTIEKLVQKKNSGPLSANEKRILLDAGSELSGRALEEPGKYLLALSRIKALNEDELSQEHIKENLVHIRKAFWQALPQETISPDRPTHPAHALDLEFVKNLDALKNE
jgi:hypothetical protein